MKFVVFYIDKNPRSQFLFSFCATSFFPFNEYPGQTRSFINGKNKIAQNENKIVTLGFCVYVMYDKFCRTLPGFFCHAQALKLRGVKRERLIE